MAELNLKTKLGDKIPETIEELAALSPEAQMELLKDYERAKQTAGQVLKNIKRVEEKTRFGADVRTMRQHMLDVRDITSKHPDRHFRWVNIAQTEKAMNGVLNGYEAFKDEKGDLIKRGNLQLMSCPRESFEERNAQRQALTDEQLGEGDDGKRRDSPEFYAEVEKLTPLLRKAGHSRSSINRIIKTTLDNVGA